MDLDFLTRELLLQFQKMCHERVAKITVLLVNDYTLSRPDEKNLQAVLRELHTLKGEARMLGMSRIS